MAQFKAHVGVWIVQTPDGDRPYVCGHPPTKEFMETKPEGTRVHYVLVELPADSETAKVFTQVTV